MLSKRRAKPTRTGLLQMKTGSPPRSITSSPTHQGEWGTPFPSGWLWGKVISRGTKDGPPRIALTFDDGPTPGGTDRILDLLAELKAPATFFVIGQNVEGYPDLLRRIDAEGHLIGNHTF